MGLWGVSRGDGVDLISGASPGMAFNAVKELPLHGRAAFGYILA